MSDQHTGFEEPNYTQTPNDFFDKILANIDHLSELKVTLAVIRKTFGWHKETIGDKISFSQLMELTGLSRQGVSDGIEKALSRGTLERWHEGKQTYSYRLKLVYVIDQSTEQTSLQDRPVPVHNVDQLEQKPVYNVDTQKKGVKETNKESSAKRTTGNSKPVNPNSSHPAITLYREVMGKFPEAINMQLIVDKVGDNTALLEDWRKTLVFWAGHENWNQTNIIGILDCFEKKGFRQNKVLPGPGHSNYQPANTGFARTDQSWDSMPDWNQKKYKVGKYYHLRDLPQDEYEKAAAAIS